MSVRVAAVLIGFLGFLAIRAAIVGEIAWLSARCCNAQGGQSAKRVPAVRSRMLARGDSASQTRVSALLWYRLRPKAGFGDKSLCPPLSGSHCRARAADVSKDEGGDWRSADALSENPSPSLFQEAADALFA